LPRSPRVGGVDRAERRGRRWRALFTAAYLGVAVWFLATPEPSRVYAADIFGILGLAPSPLDLQKLAARFRGSFQRGAEASEANEWLFDDAACVAFVRAHLDDRRTPRGRTAHLLVLWLERTVFMSIDNRRSAETGKTYAFTREAARR
jgi:hypothetical protein